MPDFQQFADRISKMFEDEPQGNDFYEFACDHLQTAERHARLLQQILEWASTGPSQQHSDPAERETLQRAKAMVRSLLVSQTEDKGR